MSTIVNDASTPNRWFYMSAYATAVKHGYTGTEEEWVQEIYGGADRASAAAEAAEASAEAASGSEESAATSASDSEAYAKGTRGGDDHPVDEDDPAYHNNSKYFAEDSEAYAIGKRDGVDVTIGDPAYQNNSLYYKNQAQTAASTAATEAEAQVIAEAPGMVTAWLEDNVDPETGYVIDKSLSVEDAAADAKATGNAFDELKKYNSYDVLAKVTKNNGTSATVVYTWNADGSCTVNGTATARSFNNIIAGSISGLLTPGADYMVYFNGDNVHLACFFYSDAACTHEISSARHEILQNNILHVPSNCAGAVIRLDVKKNIAVNNETVNVSIMNARPNSAIVKLVEACMKTNTFDILTDAPRSDKTYNGIDYEWNADGSCTVSGTASPASFHNLLCGPIDGFMTPGADYFVYFSGTNVQLRFFYYTDTTFSTEIKHETFTTNGVTTIPQNCGALIVRLDVPNGVTADETVSPSVVSALSNQTITELLDVGNSNLMKYWNSYLAGDCDDPGFDYGYIFVSWSSGSANNWANCPEEWPGWLFVNQVDPGSNISMQVWVPYYSGESNASSVLCNSYIRRKTAAGDWEPWRHLFDVHNIMIAPSEIEGDLNNLKSGLVFVSTNGDVVDCDHVPYNRPQWVVALPGLYYSSPLVFQLSLPYTSSDNIYYRIKDINDVWSNWMAISGGGGTTTIVQEVSRDTYNNTYNISTTPQITTDANGWLQPVDTDTEDETGKTDMTGAIMSMLTDTGYCHLAPGIFYVSGSIDMPAGSILEGCGENTIIRLLSSVSSGYIVRMHTKSMVKNLRFSGAYTPTSISDISALDIGGRRGINYIGNADGNDTGVEPAKGTCCMIEGCRFEFLDSGIYGYNTGGGLQNGLICNDCYFYRCVAGINLDYFVEYSKFTNVVTFQCGYACINNGGNNVFTACTFHGVIGFVIDDSSETKRNNAHGSCIGCTFNHIDNMNHSDVLGKGIAIKVINTVAGFIFADCQIWYGRVYLEDAKGIHLNGCTFGGGLDAAGYKLITTVGSDPVFIDACLFQVTPANVLGTPAKISNCWTYGGTAVTG